MRMRCEVPHERLLSVIRYDAETGVFVWSARRFGVTVGKVAGTVDPIDGYIRIRVDGIIYLAHRLAWFYVNKQWPEDEIDHRDRNRTNNRIKNLRCATRGQNQQNKAPFRNNKTGIKGVYWHKQHRKYYVTIQIKKTPIFLGLFTDIEKAKSARYKATIKHHGEFASVK